MTSKNRIGTKIIFAMLYVIFSMIAGFSIGLAWANSEGVSIGEASCGAMLSSIFFIVLGCFFILVINWKWELK